MKWLVTSTVGVIVLVVAGFLLFNSSGGTQDVTEPLLEGQPILGDEEANVTIIEFGDYKCPACKVWDETVFENLYDEYIQTGEANFAFIHAPFHGGESLLAALASESVWDRHPEAFWEYHKALYDFQPENVAHDEEWVSAEVLLGIAEDIEADIDVAQLASDLVDQTYQEEVEQDIDLVQEYNVERTPTIIINGTLIEDPFDETLIHETIQSER
ncbi:thioredoxin domain-containing protein [Geomicrobium sp. JCM 19037]|uniref:DsbA family protein n=1 Tax=Geomicrobium sp. JCM 19037 TaxID=1460634 RepID=UPI0005A85BF2|nr:thioredoxin domain-containing protein [Geomicrobium sp. JCM 19037]